MNENAPTARLGWPRIAPTAAALIVVAAVALLVAACGGSPGPSGVATLDSPRASGAASSASAAPSASDDYAQLLLAYTQCMRDHGVADLPDPEVDSNGNVRLPNLQGTGIDPTSATFRAADAACQSFMPTPPPEARQPMSPADQAKWLQFAACVRSHGVPNYPDPNFSNGGPKPFFDLQAAGVDGSSPTLNSATEACRSLLPVINGGSGTSGASGSSPSPSPTSQP